MINPKTIFVWLVVIFVSQILLGMIFNIGADYYILRKTGDYHYLLDDTLGVLISTDLKVNQYTNEILNFQSSGTNSEMEKRYLSTLQKDVVILVLLIFVWIALLTWVVMKSLSEDKAYLLRLGFSLFVALGILAIIEMLYSRYISGHFIIPFTGLKNFVWNWDQIFRLESFFVK